MKHILSILIIILVSYILSLYLPWWSIVITPFLAGYFLPYKIIAQLLIGFISIGMLWTIQCYCSYTSNAADLVPRIGQLFSGLSPSLLIVTSGFLGGLYGSLSQLSGYLLKKTTQP